MATPDYDQYIEEAFGWPDEVGFGGYSDYCYFTAGINLLVGTNPPYSAVDFLAFFPNFGGIPTLLSATTDGTTPNLTNLANVTGLAVGQLLAGPGIPDPATIVSISGTGPYSVVISGNTTVAATNKIIFYTELPIPLAVINVFIALASASIFQARWGELWAYAVALYVAHNCELWLQAQSAPPGSTASQIVAAGLALGIKTAKGVQDVSASYAILNDLEGWGSYQLTLYGQILATYAQTIGSGSMLVW